MTNDITPKFREYIATMTYSMGREISPLRLYHITLKDSELFGNRGWTDVMMSLHHKDTRLIIQYTGVRKG